MAPTIDNGDKLIVEHWNGTQIQDNKIYVFCFNNEFFVKRLSKNLDEIIIKVLKCKQIHKPTLIPYYHGKVKKDCGVSCYSFFDGGYITFHIFEKRRIAYFDIVSNESFDVDKVIKFASKICETKKYNIYTNSTTNEICNKDVFGPHYIASGTLRKQMNINQLLMLLLVKRKQRLRLNVHVSKLWKHQKILKRTKRKRFLQQIN